jgi:hypothetical protein
VSTDDKMKEMDDAASTAKKELLEHLDRWSAKAVASWWAVWYLKAGHKRLGRILVDLARKSE